MSCGPSKTWARSWRGAAFVERALSSMPPKAYRWIGEMEEIARCFEDLGLPGRLMLGAADVYTNVRDGGLLATELPLAPPVARVPNA